MLLNLSSSQSKCPGLHIMADVFCWLMVVLKQLAFIILLSLFT